MVAHRKKNTSTERNRARHRVVMVGYPNAQILDITGPLEVFARASRWLVDHNVTRLPAYTVELVAPQAGPLRCSSGLSLLATRCYRDVRQIDTLLVTGGIGYADMTGDAEFLRWLSRKAARVQRIGSICTGALVLAAAGLLHNRAATTHWAYYDRLATASDHTAVKRDAPYVRTGNLYTSAGVLTGMDMALAMVEEDWGRKVARAVAHELMMVPRASPCA